MSPSLGRQAPRAAKLVLALLGGVLVLALMAASASAGTVSKRDRSGDVKRQGLTANERRALDIVSVTAVGGEPFGLIVTIRFKGNFERAIGRGHLRSGLAAIGLAPKSSRQRPAIVATDGRGHFGKTVRSTRSTDVLVRRSGREVTFYIFGAGLSNVRRIYFGSFAKAPTTRQGRRATSSQLTGGLLGEVFEAMRSGDADDGDFFRLQRLFNPSCDELRKTRERLRAEEEALTRDYDRALAERRRIAAGQIDRSRDKVIAEIASVEQQLAAKCGPPPGSARTCVFDHGKTGSDSFLVGWRCDQAHSSVLFDFSAEVASIDPSVGNAQPPVCQIDASDTSLVRCNGPFQAGEDRVFLIRTTAAQSCPDFRFVPNVNGTVFAEKPCS